MRRKLKIGESLLLLVPCLALGGFAWRKTLPANSHNPYEPILESAVLVPVTPREVHEGWDTKFLVTVLPAPHTHQMSGYKWVGYGAENTFELSYYRAGKWVTVTRASSLVTAALNLGDKYEVSVLMKLRSLPVSSQTTRLKVSVREQQTYNTLPPKGVRGRSVVFRSLPITAATEVRHPNQKIVMPQVSHYRPFALKNVTLSDHDYPEDQVRVTLSQLEGASDIKKVDLKSWPLYLEDEQGRRYSSFNVGGSSQSFGYTNYDHNPPGQWRYGWGFYLSSIPKSAGQLTLNAMLSINDCWPLPLKVVVRHHDGSLPIGALKNEASS